MSRCSSAKVFGGSGMPSGVCTVARRSAALRRVGLNLRMPAGPGWTLSGSQSACVPPPGSRARGSAAGRPLRQSWARAPCCNGPVRHAATPRTRASATRCRAGRSSLADAPAFQTFLAALRKVEWVVYAKRPFGGPDAVLGYLSRYTHRIAIANSRLVAFDGTRVTFKWKDYRTKADARYKLMTLDANEFIRRFLIHVLPDGFHRIRHYALFAKPNRPGNTALAHRLLGVPDPAPATGESAATRNRLEDT